MYSLKFSNKKYQQNPLKTKALLKRDPNTGAYLWILQNTYFEEHLLTATSDFLKQMQNPGVAAASVLTLLLSSDNLLTVH